MLQNNQFTSVLLLVALALAIYYLSRPAEVRENMTEPSVDEQAANEVVSQVPNSIVDEIVAEGETEEEPSVNQFMANDFGSDNGASLDQAFALPVPQEERNVVDINKNNVKKYDSKDYLPQEVNDEWFETDFTNAKYELNDDNLINTDRYVIGINTVGQSLKNASWDIRGTIANPKFKVSPWNNSTIEPDHNIKSLC